MPRLPRYDKNIACFESLWDRDYEKRLTVSSVLSTIATLNRVKFTHFSCNTEPEFVYNLKLIHRRSGYRVLYFALHGSPGRIELDSCQLELEELGEILGRKFEGWIVHFGTCQTIRVPEPRLQAFIDRTKLSMVVGYRRSVDWLEAAAVDILFLDLVQRYRDTAPMWRRFSTRYADLVRHTQMTATVRSSPRRRN